MLPAARLEIRLADPSLTRSNTPLGIEWVSDDGDIRISAELCPKGYLAHLFAWREIASSRNIYYACARDRIVIADSFRDILASLDPDDRRLDPDAVVAHLLFRTVPAERTYVSAVRRLGAGCALTWDSNIGALQVSEPTRLESVSGKGAPTDISSWLEGQSEGLRHRTGVVNLLSGGIDSTLVQTYLGESVPTLSATMDSEEFADEVRYALAASSMLGSRHRLVHCSETAWADNVVDAVRASGLPPHHLQTTLIHRAFDTEFESFVTSLGADGLFGFEAAAIAPDLDTLGRQVRDAIYRRLPLRILPRHRHADLWLSRGSVRDPCGYGASFALFTDLGLIEEYFGRDAVIRALHNRLDYTLKRLPAKIPPGIHGHLHVGHWVDYFCEDTFAIWRQLGFSRKKMLVTPFGTPDAARIAIGIPAFQRYARRGRVKYLLKDLLKSRLPAYDVDQRKGHSGLPLERFVADGFVDTLVERYGVPTELTDLAVALQSREMRQKHAQTWWNIATFAVWTREVLANPDLRPHLTGYPVSFPICVNQLTK